MLSCLTGLVVVCMVVEAVVNGLLLFGDGDCDGNGDRLLAMCSLLLTGSATASAAAAWET